jgi:hypothetical protein
VIIEVGPAPRRVTGRIALWPATATFVLVPFLGVVLVLSACSGSSARRDDRTRVRDAVQGFATRLVSVHDIAGPPAAAIGDCHDNGWAAVSWSAPLVQHTADPLEAETNVLGLAETSPLRLDVTRVLDPRAPAEPADVFSTKDAQTQLTLTITGQRVVRVDGYASCPARD